MQTDISNLNSDQVSQLNTVISGWIALAQAIIGGDSFPIGKTVVPANSTTPLSTIWSTLISFNTTTSLSTMFNAYSAFQTAVASVVSNFASFNAQYSAYTAATSK